MKSEVGSKFKLNCVAMMVEATRRSGFGRGRYASRVSKGVGLIG
jgi:hypothetical protein